MHSFPRLLSYLGNFAAFIIFFRPLPGSSAANVFSNGTREGATAHSPLFMSSQGIMTCKTVAAFAGIWLHAGVDFGMAFQIMATDKTLAAVVTFKLPIPKVSLDVRFNIFLSAEAFVTSGECANPFAVGWIRPLDICSDLVKCDAGLLNGSIDGSVEIQVSYGQCSGRQKGLCG